MSDRDATQLLARPVWRDPRLHLLDDLWLLTIFAVLFATALPWLVSGLAIDLIAAAGALVVLGAIHVALAALAGRGPGQSARRPRLLSALHVVGVLAMAYVWQHAGGLQNPLFLAVFALPIVGSIFLSRWHPYFVAALAVMVVALIAVIEAPELRWYAPGVDAVVDWGEKLLGRGNAGGGGQPFAGFYAPSDYYLVLLEVFAILMLACAVAAEYLGTVFERLHGQVAGALIEAERGEQLSAAVLEQLPLPAFVVDADTCEISFASGAALARFAPHDGRLIGRGLFEVLRFSYPELVHELISGAGGIARPSMVRVAGRLLATDVRVQHLAQKGRRLALVTVQDMTDSLCIKAALDVAEHAAIVLDTEGRVLAWNKPATALFPQAQLDTEISYLLPRAPAEGRWWDPGLSGRRKAHVTVMQHVYQLTCCAVPLPGEDERLYIVAFVPAAQVATADQDSTAFTLARRPMTAARSHTGDASSAARAAALAACAAIWLHCALAAAATDDRLVFSGNGSTLTGDHGGGGAAATWLRQFDSGSLVGLGAEYETIYNSHWTLGSFNGALALGQLSVKTSLYAEGHLGSGDTAGEPFHYTNVAVGVITTPASWLSLQLEERYIDIQPSRGNLPKLGVSFHVSPTLLATVSYAQSFGGNLDTKLGTARLDYVGSRFTWLLGGAYGPVAPRVLNLIGQTVGPAKTLKEGFIGAGRSFGGTDWQLIGDYQDLEGFKRTTITLNCTVHLGTRRPS